VKANNHQNPSNDNECSCTATSYHGYFFLLLCFLVYIVILTLTKKGRKCLAKTASKNTFLTEILQNNLLFVEGVVDKIEDVAMTTILVGLTLLEFNV
jgi:hypothetical protein